MKRHLMNVLNQLEATAEEKEVMVAYFKDKTVTHSAVVEKFNTLRK